MSPRHDNFRILSLLCPNFGLSGTQQFALQFDISQHMIPLHQKPWLFNSQKDAFNSVTSPYTNSVTSPYTNSVTSPYTKQLVCSY